MRIKEILHREFVSCIPYEECAAKKYHKYLKEHPELNEDDIRMYVDSQEDEEDYYGHGGGVTRTLVIYRWREETQEEINERINERDQKVIDQFNKDFGKVFKSLQKNCEGIHEISSIEKIYNSTQECIDYYFKNNYLESKKIKFIPNNYVSYN